MNISKRSKPIVLFPLQDVESRRGVITLTTIQTKEQEVLREMLKDPRIGMLGVISPYNGRVDMQISHLNIPVQNCFFKRYHETSFSDNISIAFSGSISPSVANRLSSVVKCADSSSVLGLPDPMNTYVLHGRLKRIVIND